MTDNLRVEFHCHTIFSKDSLTQPEVLIKTCQRMGIDKVVVTDHNTIAGALAAKSIDPERVIVGEEILTTRGEVLAAFVQEEIPPGLTPEETIKRLRDQGAFISLSHPFDIMRKGHWREKDILEIIHLIDAIEIFNARCMKPAFNHQAQHFAEEHNLPGTVGSDAHAAFELGRATFTVPQFDNPDGLRAVIGNARIHAKLSSPLVHLTSRYATIIKKFKRLKIRLT